MIYTDFWGLSFPPFANDNRPETFIPTHSAGLTLARLRYALGTGMGVSALFGEAGVGKTRIARMIADEFFKAGWLTAYLPGPAGVPRDIFGALNPEAASLVTAGSSGLREMQSFLVAMAANHRPVLIIVDDAHTARGTEFLENLRTLLNLEYHGIKALSILLVGQAGLDRRLAAASRFDSQLQIRAVLEPMRNEEAKLYILARLKAAGSSQGIFTMQSADLVVKFSRGNPRQVNRLCELSLVVAYGLESERVTPDVVEMAAADLDMLPPGEASFFPWPHPEPLHEPEEGAENKDEEDILAKLAAEGVGDPGRGQ